MGSSRLPGKVLLPLGQTTVLGCQVSRMQRAKIDQQIVVAIPTLAIDDPIEHYCQLQGIDCFRGHPTDVLDRHYQVAKSRKADVVLKIPLDCPLIDPPVIERVVSYYLDNSFDYVSNLHPQSYPDGSDVEVFSFEALEKAWKESTRDVDREHTTPYFWDPPGRFGVGNVEMPGGQDLSKTLRFTIDYPEDYELIRAIYERLEPTNPHFELKDVLDLLQREPQIAKLNEKHLGQYWYYRAPGELEVRPQ